MGITVRIQNPDGEKIMDKVVQNSPEKFAFTTVVPGEHYVCLSADAGWIGRGAAIKVYFDVVMGEGANDYDEIRRKDKLDDIQLRVRQLLDQINQISKEQAYQRVREARFRHTSEATNSRVIYWSCAQFAILIVAGLWQTRHLRGFFEAKKLV
ncbi:hypothetical protein SARC_03141 [Sphaeroforma arctica JP610]|uniref:GOLD domain-containing protein n=1 Tax=Sphaeroforma arctica JP610 TaxID=667725 RepID=A0A0L0G6K5_9EUKA|nr:hypothetical protein SARC_03141 [Sphaeroforma arctica JP610]KNC84650.1 hypothetical protein SARC_03141 [Sphaeroforma arctica JP610]|eukprot:XP_014158552.1 hypothetical protein SARC_03141 [Sphaeroforma arctica JP610]